VGVFSCPHYDVVALQRSQGREEITSIERNETVSTVTIEADTVSVEPALMPVRKQGFWARIGQGLKNWGRKLKSAVKKVGGFFARAFRAVKDKIVAAAKWVWRTPPVQWVVTKVTTVAKWVWHTPVGKWAAAGVGAFFFAPNVIGIVAVAGIAALVIAPILLWRSMTPEERQQIIIHASPVDETVFDEEPTADETINERYTYLDGLLTRASDDADSGAYSELTARMFVLDVRGGLNTKLKKTATASDIHRECRRNAEKQLVSNIPGFRWDWNRMWAATQSEDARLKQVAKLKAEQANMAVA